MSKSGIFCQYCPLVQSCDSLTPPVDIADTPVKPKPTELRDYPENLPARVYEATDETGRAIGRVVTRPWVEPDDVRSGFEACQQPVSGILVDPNQSWQRRLTYRALGLLGLGKKCLGYAFSEELARQRNMAEGNKELA